MYVYLRIKYWVDESTIETGLQIVHMLMWSSSILLCIFLNCLDFNHRYIGGECCKCYIVLIGILQYLLHKMFCKNIVKLMLIKLKVTISALVIVNYMVCFNLYCIHRWYYVNLYDREVMGNITLVVFLELGVFSNSVPRICGYIFIFLYKVWLLNLRF